MAKKFLDSLGDAFEDNMLVDVIPTRRSSRSKKKNLLKPVVDTSDPPKKKRRTSNSRKTQRKKSFLDTIEDALDNNAFDDFLPADTSWKGKGNSSTTKVSPNEKPFSTMITAEVLDRAREIAIQKGIRVKDVINFALKRYVENME